MLIRSTFLDPLFISPLFALRARGRVQRHKGAEAFGGTGRAVRDAVFLPIKLTTVVEGPEVGQTLMKSIRLLLTICLCSDAR